MNRDGGQEMKKMLSSDKDLFLHTCALLENKVIMLLFFSLFDI